MKTHTSTRNSLVAWSWFTCLLSAAILMIATTEPNTAQSARRAVIHVDAGQPVGPFPAGILGTNMVGNRNYADATTGNGQFIDSARSIGPTMIRWPGGNNADMYDWKRLRLILPGRRISSADQVNLDDIIVFCREIGAELTVTINFGTMSAEDAADMVEFCNGPATTFWGRKRDSILVSRGYAPGPLNVRYFEIGNETAQKHMYERSWTAAHAAQYFLGGEAERRGAYRISSGGTNYRLPLGDLIAVRPGDGNDREYVVRFPPLRNPVVFFIPDSAALADCIVNGNCNFERFERVATLAGQPADRKVFTIDTAGGTVRFGDGVNGFFPPVGSYLLVEYTTFGRDGFVAFARKMRQVPSSVPVRIGAVMLPREGTVPQSTWVPSEYLDEVYGEMDFLIVHHYLPTNGSRGARYAYRRQVAAQRVAKQDSVYRLFRDASRAALGREKPLGLAITEWSLFNKNDSLVVLNRSLETAVAGAEWLIRTANRSETTPAWFAEQFNLASWKSKFALVETETPNLRVCPLGYVFRGFRALTNTDLLPVRVDSPAERAFDRPVTLVQATGGLAATKDAVLLALVNNAERDAVVCSLDVRGFSYDSLDVWLLAGSTPTANNDGEEGAYLRRVPVNSPEEFTLPPFSVAFARLWHSGVNSVEADVGVPAAYEATCYPNPAALGTIVQYSVPRKSMVRVTIFDVRGKRLRTLANGIAASGTRTVAWDGRDEGGNPVPPGAYMYRVQTAMGVLTGKVVLQR